ncbi:SDR family oxidoreductase [Mycolicibacterium mengxianglii]|uniref:SDR family oxidoreductase n=1 Tax=Mycolicibacterium mengxianglii TaxID=2736649 RepID=UPI0018D1C412|nr:SDR family oxidoreductase [Mycolicibacterium mengxianglii]
MELSGNTILVTGGSTGIGRGLAEAFHRLGNHVVICGRRAEPLAEVAHNTPGIDYLTLDQADAADIERFAAELLAAHPGLNVVINNAGIQLVEHVLDGDVALAEQTIVTNLLGVICLTAHLLPALVATPRAAILNVTSALAFMPSALVPTYCATKAGLHSYTQSLRYQLRDTSVEVIELIPPKVQTGLQGVHGHDPDAMPLDEYITETIDLLRQRPDSTEIVVKRAEGLRYAERRGVYDDLYPTFNDAAAAVLEGPPAADPAGEA